VWVVGAELMVLGFVSLLLNVFQGSMQRICLRKGVMDHLLPCPRPSAKTAAHYGAAVFTGVLSSTGDSWLEAAVLPVVTAVRKVISGSLDRKTDPIHVLIGGICRVWQWVPSCAAPQ
jgi:hypothetical protein